MTPRLPLACLIVLASCTRSVAEPPPPAPPAASAARREAAPSSAAASGSPAIDGCAPDIASRAPDAEVVEPLDIDDDGVPDLVFRAGQSIHGNSDFHFYRTVGRCAVYLGKVESFITNTPRCVEPRQPGRICRLSAMERMFHEDYQETFYEHGPNGFAEAGHGRYLPPTELP